MKQLLALIVLTVFVSGFPLLSFAQQTLTERLGFGIYISPEMNSLAIEGKKTYQSVQPKFGFSAGAEMNLTLRNRLLIRLGFGCGFKQFTYSNEQQIYSSYSPQGEFIYPIVTVTYETAFHEIHVPLLFHYKFSRPFFIGGGIEYIKPYGFLSFLTISGNPDVPYKRTSTYVEHPKTLAVSLSMGYRLKLTESFHLLLEPTFRMDLKGYRFYADEMSSKSNHFYSVGLKTTFWIGGK